MIATPTWTPRNQHTLPLAAYAAARRAHTGGPEAAAETTPADTGNPPEAGPIDTGNPAASTPGSPPDSAETAPPRRRRGRPRRAHTGSAAETTPVDTGSPPDSAEPTPRRRGRPRRAHTGSPPETAPIDTGNPLPVSPDPRPTAERRVCRECGCSDFAACPGGCYWVELDLCSRCASRLTPRASDATITPASGPSSEEWTDSAETTDEIYTYLSSVLNVMGDDLAPTWGSSPPRDTDTPAALLRLLATLADQGRATGSLHLHIEVSL